jgi:hypothetical protein
MVSRQIRMLGCSIVLVGLFVVGGASVTSAQELELVSRLTVVDANGALVGEVISVNESGNEAVVAFRKGIIFAVKVNHERFRTDANVEVHYESADCTGPVFIRDLRRGVRLFPAVAAIDNVIYVAPNGRATTRITSNSESLEDGTCVDGGYSGPAVRVSPLEDMNTRYTPPFRLRLP